MDRYCWLRCRFETHNRFWAGGAEKVVASNRFHLFLKDDGAPRIAYLLYVAQYPWVLVDFAIGLGFMKK